MSARYRLYSILALLKSKWGRLWSTKATGQDATPQPKVLSDEFKHHLQLLINEELFHKNKDDAQK